MIDYFPGDSATRAEVALQDFVALVDTVLSPGEPHAADRAIRPLAIGEYQVARGRRGSGCGSIASRVHG